MIKKINHSPIFSAVALVLTVAVAPSHAADIFSADFNSNNGGFTASSVNPLNASPSAPWTFGAAVGNGNSGGWSAGPEEGQGNPVEHLLTSPLVTLTASGAVSLSFDHSYDFEDGWDGGALNISVNGGAFAQVPNGNFTLSGYSGTVQDRDDWGYVGDMNGVAVFTGTIANFTTSQADLGSFIAGDTIQIQFRAGWDWNGLGQDSTRGWNIDNVALSASPVPLPAAVWLFGSAIVGMGAIRGRKHKTA